MIKIKVVLLGEAHVGKTVIINQYISYSFQVELCATLTTYKSRKDININENT